MIFGKGERVSQVEYLGKGLSVGRESQFKGPEVRVCRGNQGMARGEEA